ncbi:MAG: hypothetical protein ABJE95_11440 [Byssovorax sp.]
MNTGVRSSRAGDASTLRAMHGLPEAALRQTVLGERLAQQSAASAAALIEQILRGAAAGDPSSRSGAVALTLWILAEPAGSAIVARIREAALAGGRLAVAAILGAGPARCAIAARGRLAEIGIAVEGPLAILVEGPMAFMYRPAWRRLLTRTRLHQLLRHHDPRMIRRLVASRAILLEHVVTIAARRPTTAAIVREICASRRWMLHAEVREAIAANPFTPADVLLALLPTLPRIELRRLRSGASTALVAGAAGHLLDLGLRAERIP